MKLSSLFCLLVTLSILGFSCKKEKEKLNIKLSDKSLDIIKSYIKGNWKLYRTTNYAWSPNEIYYKNSFIDFKENDKIYWLYENGFYTEGNITWIRDKDLYGDSTFLMRIDDSNGNYVPPTKVIVEIRNDTLIIADNSIHEVLYELVR